MFKNNIARLFFILFGCILCFCFTLYGTEISLPSSDSNAEIQSLTTAAEDFLSEVTHSEAEALRESNAQKYGFFTLIPPLIAILLAFITKNVVISLFLGILSGTFMLVLHNTSFIGTIYQSFEKFTSIALGSLADSWNAGIILQVLTIGGLIALITRLGGARAVAQALSQYARSPKSSQLITWFLGLFIFFDDYANSLIVGPIMKPVTGKHRISREKLSFIIDGTAAPVAGIMFVSTWIGYELSVIKDGFMQIGQDVSPFNIFIATIPYRFYNILMLLFIVFIIVLGRDFGPMYRAEKRARQTGELVSKNAIPLSSDEEKSFLPKENIPLRTYNALIPIGTLIISALVLFYTNGKNAILSGSNETLIYTLHKSPFSFSSIQETFGASDAAIVLFQAALIASIVTILLGSLQKAWSIKEALDTWIAGMQSLLITGIILILAWSLAAVVKELGTAYFLSDFLEGTIPAFLLPSLIFIFACIISFSTGTSYGTMGILMPLAIPIAHAMVSTHSNLVLISISAVLAGAILGDHCSPISDTTILSSMGAGCDHVDHVKTQLPYALTVGTIAIIVGYIPLGLGLPITLVLPMAILVTFLIIRFVGKKLDEDF